MGRSGIAQAGHRDLFIGADDDDVLDRWGDDRVEVGTDGGNHFVGQLRVAWLGVERIIGCPYRGHSGQVDHGGAGASELTRRHSKGRRETAQLRDYVGRRTGGYRTWVGTLQTSRVHQNQGVCAGGDGRAAGRQRHGSASGRNRRALLGNAGPSDAGAQHVGAWRCRTVVPADLDVVDASRQRRGVDSFAVEAASRRSGKEAVRAVAGRICERSDVDIG